MTGRLQAPELAAKGFGHKVFEGDLFATGTLRLCKPRKKGLERSCWACGRSRKLQKVILGGSATLALPRRHIFLFVGFARVGGVVVVYA